MHETQPPSPLTRLRAELAGPRGRRRVDALLSADDPAAAVAALSSTELYELVHEVGFEETTELIALATPEQVRGCFDIELWDRDQLVVEAARPWLAALLDAGFEKLGQVWSSLDAELRALLLQRHTTIYDLTLGEEPDDSDGHPLLFTVDSFFAVKLTSDEDTVRLIHALIDELYRADAALARHTLMAARSELTSELEDTSYRWRSGRMADLGFVDFYEALDLFRPLEVDAVHVGEGSQERFGPAIEDDEHGAPQTLPVVIAEQVIGRSFLARALDRLDGEDALRVQQAILLLVNKVMSAARVKAGDLEALRRGAAYATATASLGLETVARGDLERAAQALGSVAMLRLHRVGYTVTLKLARVARGLAPRAGTAGPPASALIAGLTAARPWFARVVEDPLATGVRPFESQADIRRAAEVLARLALRIALVEGLGVNLAAMGQQREPRPDLDDHIRTAMVRAMAGGPFRPDALRAEELDRFRATCLVGGTLTEAARQGGEAAALRALTDAHLPAGRDALPALSREWLDDVERILGGIKDAKIDARFVEGVIVEV